MERVSLVDVSEPSVPGIGNSLGMTVGNPRHNKRDDEMETGLSLSIETRLHAVFQRIL